MVDERNFGAENESLDGSLCSFDQVAQVEPQAETGIDFPMPCLHDTSQARLSAIADGSPTHVEANPKIGLSEANIEVGPFRKPTIPGLFQYRIAKSRS